ncbi:MAG: hypothetical protein K0S88_2291 [Actinomycetia bacterium]|nr:hypothetical protein [Actinomycetes bacterium]
MATLPNERIQALDVVRGFALCGIVPINIYQTLGMRDLPAGLELFVLALLGGLHHLLQPGEVLLPYAICGLVFLLPFSYARPVVNLVAGVALLGAGMLFVGGAGLIPGCS